VRSRGIQQSHANAEIYTVLVEV
jgi:hypothetical protein